MSTIEERLATIEAKLELLEEVRQDVKALLSIKAYWAGLAAGVSVVVSTVITVFFKLKWN